MSKLDKLENLRKERLIQAERIGRMYPIILLACRLILSGIHFWVILDSYFLFSSIIRDNRETELDLSQRFDKHVDLEWVPVSTISPGDSTDPNYGQNKLFNYFIIHLVNYLQRQVANLTLYMGIAICTMMILLSVADVYALQQKRFNKAQVNTANSWLRFFTLSAALLVACVQAVVILHHNSNICHMEIIYPFLFSPKSNDSGVHSLLLRGESCVQKRRIIACILFTMASLVPDAYLLTMNTIRTLRLYSIVNFLKIAGAMIALGFFIMCLIVRQYMSAAMDPKRFGDRATLNFMKHSQLHSVKQHYPKTGWTLHESIKSSTSDHVNRLKYLPVPFYRDFLDARMRMTLDSLSKNPTLQFSPPLELYQRLFNKNPQPTDKETREMAYLHYAHTQGALRFASLTLESFTNINLLIALSCFITAAFAFVLVIKRHRLLAMFNCFVEAAGAVTFATFILLLTFSLDASKLYCNASTYIPSGKSTFESMAIYTWMCRMAPLFYFALGLSGALTLVCVVDFVLLIMLIV